MSIKHYQLAKGEELPEEFCVVRDVNGEPGEYTFYVNEAKVAKLLEYITKLEQANIVLSSDNCDLRNNMKDMQFFIAENRKLRELVCHLYYAKPRDVTSILVNGEVLDFDELMAEVGLRWENEA